MSLYVGELSGLGLEPWPIGQYLHQLSKAELQKIEAGLIEDIRKTSIFRPKTKAELKERLAKVQEALYSMKSFEERATFQKKTAEIERVISSKPKPPPDIVMPAKKGLVPVPVVEDLIPTGPAPSFDLKKLFIPGALVLTVLVGGFFVLRK